MPFIEMGDDFKDAKEGKTAPNGQYDLKCREVDHITEGGKNHIRVIVDILADDPDTEYNPIFHTIALPSSKDAENDEKKGHKEGTTRKMKQLMAKRFLHLFDVPFTDDGFDPNDITGSTARATLEQDEYQGVTRNVIRLPQLPEEN